MCVSSPCRDRIGCGQALLLPLHTVLRAAAQGLDPSTDNDELLLLGGGIAARAWLYSACHALAMHPPTTLQRLYSEQQQDPTQRGAGYMWLIAQRAVSWPLLTVCFCLRC